MNSRDITNALARHLDYRKNVIVPRCHFAGAEADLLCLRPSDWLEEFEIKVSLGDFKREFTEKADKHSRLVGGELTHSLLTSTNTPISRGSFDRMQHKIRRFWFVVPHELLAKVKDLVPAHAGLVTVQRTSSQWRNAFDVVAVAKPAPAIAMARKLTPAERCDLCRLAYLRYWDIEAKEVVEEVAA
jgi:hypothetical protein